MTPRSPWVPDPSGSVAAMRSAARRITLNVPMRLICTTRAKASRASTTPLPLMTRPGVPTPAQLTAMRIGPSPAATSRAAATWASSVTSVRAKVAPKPWAMSVPFSARSSTTTCAPAACNRRAVARPRPEAPPVTTATLPSICMPGSFPFGNRL